MNSAKRAGDGGKYGVGLVLRKGLLADEDLPQAHQRLERAGGVGTESRLVNLVEGFHRVEELHDGLVADGARLAEDGVLCAEFVVVPRQAVHGGGQQGLRAVAIQVADGHENLQRLVLHGLP